MPKRRSDVLGDGRKAKRPRRHLYVVVDDGDGYAIRKIDFSSDPDSDDEAERPHHHQIMTERRLPPALIRLFAPTCEYFASIGTKIMVTHCEWPNRAVPIFDVGTRSLNLGPRPKACPHEPIYVSVGDKLVSVDAGGVELLYPPPPASIRCDWVWRKLPKPPFKHHEVACCAVHPDERTIFFGIGRSASTAIFLLDTGTAEWKRCGEGKLPFAGQAYFDRALDAWVGLSSDPAALGYLCACDVAVPNADYKQSLPWKLSRDKIFCEDPAEEHIGAVLVYMGGRSKYCIAQCVSVQDDERSDNDDESNNPYYSLEVKEEDRPRRHLLRLTTFSLTYDKNGDLCTATQRRVRCYQLPPNAEPIFNDFRAFWM